MTKRHHMIDQRGKIVYVVNDRGSCCKGCCYRKYSKGTLDFRNCETRVPAEHYNKGALLECIIGNMTYRETPDA